LIDKAAQAAATNEGAVREHSPFFHRDAVFVKPLRQGVGH
jgi:hypothetical protein